MQNLRLACKAKYKLAVRNAYVSFEDKLSDELYSHFVNIRIPEFWKSWNATFRRNVNKPVNINGYCNDTDIANEFVVHFNKVFRHDDDKMAYNDFLHKRAECIRDNLQTCYECVDKISVECIDKCLRTLKLAKACGPDDLSTEHMLYAHPSLIVHLQILFKLIMSHGYVPNSCDPQAFWVP